MNFIEYALLKKKIFHSKLGKLFKKKFITSIEGHTLILPLDKNPIIVDLGANKGGFMEKVIPLVHPKRYIAIEPNRNFLEKLKANARKHESMQFTLHNFAITGKEKKEILYVGNNPEATSISSKFTSAACGINSTQEIQCHTLEHLFRMNKLEKIDFLKIDVEGAETEIILNSSKETLTKCKNISIEFHNALDWKDNTSLSRTLDAINRLNKFGFRPYFFSDQLDDVLFVRE